MSQAPSAKNHDNQETAPPQTEATQTPCLHDKARSPYLRIFGAEDGCHQVDLDWRQMKIGRGSGVQIRLNDNAVSRNHAYLFTTEGKYFIEDCGSRSGTMVNGNKIDSPVQLKHGDSVQITHFVLQFRTDASGAKLLPGRFSRLPSSMEMRYRIIYHHPGELFAPGDTLAIGQGGILIPMDIGKPDTVCVEIELTWPDRQKRRFFGEILGTMPGSRTLACVKIHRVDQDTYQSVIQGSQRGDWVTVESE